MLEPYVDEEGRGRHVSGAALFPDDSVGYEYPEACKAVWRRLSGRAYIQQDYDYARVTSGTCRRG